MIQHGGCFCGMPWVISNVEFVLEHSTCLLKKNWLLLDILNSTFFSATFSHMVIVAITEGAMFKSYQFSYRILANVVLIAVHVEFLKLYSDRSSLMIYWIFLFRQGKANMNLGVKRKTGHEQSCSPKEPYSIRSKYKLSIFRLHSRGLLFRLQGIWLLNMN